MGKTLIFIWGGAILLYILVQKNNNTSAVITSLQNFVGGTTSILQGR